MTADPARTYRKPFGCLHHRGIRDEIARLDAQADCQRIVHLLACYEFPFDLQRSLELALFHTYGSVRVSRLLARTGEFTRRGQKRYDDTRILITHFLESGWTEGPGRRALERMNAIHGHFAIDNDDFLFVLATFVNFPIDWMRDYGWRPFTPHEARAWFAFFQEIGRRMGLRGIPETKGDLDRFVEDYERRHLVYAPANREIADATIRVMENWLPRGFRRLVRPAVCALIGDRLLGAFGYSRPPRWFCTAVTSTLKLRRLPKRVIQLERYPTLIATARNRTYPGNRYAIEDIGPFAR